MDLNTETNILDSATGDIANAIAILSVIEFDTNDDRLEKVRTCLQKGIKKIQNLCAYKIAEKNLT